MKRGEVLRLGQVVDDFLKDGEHRVLREKLREAAVRDTIQSLLGHNALYLRSVSLYDNKVFLAVSSSVLRNDLVIQRASLLNTLREKLNDPTLNEIIIR
jgi:hypothetical protein